MWLVSFAPLLPTAWIHPRFLTPLKVWSRWRTHCGKAYCFDIFLNQRQACAACVFVHQARLSWSCGCACQTWVYRFSPPARRKQDQRQRCDCIRRTLERQYDAGLSQPGRCFFPPLRFVRSQGWRITVGCLTPVLALQGKHWMRDPNRPAHLAGSTVAGTGLRPFWRGAIWFVFNHEVNVLSAPIYSLPMPEKKCGGVLREEGGAMHRV